MGRKDTVAVKTIQKMYEQLRLDREDILHRTKMLLGVYRDVVWITLNKSEGLNEEIIYYGDDLNSALVYLEQFAPDIERQEFENRVCSLFENKWMIDLIDTAMGKIYDYHNNGKLYHEILLYKTRDGVPANSEIGSNISMHDQVRFRNQAELRPILLRKIREFFGIEVDD